jgi:hypothetical protein
MSGWSEPHDWNRDQIRLPLYLTEKELADRWRKKVATIKDWRFRNSENLPAHYKIGSQILFHIDDVLAFEQRCKIEGEA